MQTKLKTYRRGSVSELNIWRLLGISMILFFTACTDFVEVDLPKSQLSSEAVFNDPSTVEAALKSIYSKMRSNSRLYSHLGAYTDELVASTSLGSLEAYQNHAIFANDAFIKSFWGSTYNQIYAANAIIEGIENSEFLTPEDKEQYKGEALFIRSYLYTFLVALFGDVPYITTTDYIENTTVSRMSKALIYDHVITDLSLAVEVLSDTDITEDNSRTRPYKVVAEAVLARTYLYTEQWALARDISDSVISKYGALEPDLNKVFLKEASGTIWQFKPDIEGQNTREGEGFIFTTDPRSLRRPFLNDALFFAFESGNLFQLGDQRRESWIKIVTSADGTQTWRHAYKYKEKNSTGSSSLEYSIQLRLAEQYLIRAEARAQLGDIPGAQADINAIRNRAGLSNTRAATLVDLLDAILQERRVELFTEKGHRWFDLKRMGKAKEALQPIKPGWRDTDILFPIPESDILLNPNLLPQNDGY